MNPGGFYNYIGPYNSQSNMGQFNRLNFESKNPSLFRNNRTMASPMSMTNNSMTPMNQMNDSTGMLPIVSMPSSINNNSMNNIPQMTPSNPQLITPPSVPTNDNPLIKPTPMGNTGINPNPMGSSIDYSFNTNLINSLLNGNNTRKLF